MTALAMFIVFSLSLLLVGFYGYAFMNGDSCTSDAECDSGHCGPYGDFIPDGRSNICVECLADTDCSGVACDTTIGQCMITLPSANTVLPQPRPILVCGNGVLEQGEQCDDGNIQNGDGCTSACAIEVRGGFEVGNRIYVKMEVSSTPKLWAFDLNAGGSNCQIDVIEEDNIVTLFWSVDDQCTAKHKLGTVLERSGKLSDDQIGSCSGGGEGPQDVLDKPFGTNANLNCNEYTGVCGLNENPGSRSVFGGVSGSGPYAPKGDLYCDTEGSWVLCNSAAAGHVYTDPDGTQWLCDGKDFTKYTKPALVPAPSTRTGSNLCSGVACSAGSICRWGNCVKALNNGGVSNFTEIDISTGNLCTKTATRNTDCTTQTLEFALIGDVMPACIYSVNVTDFSVYRRGAMCAGDECKISSPHDVILSADASTPSRMNKDIYGSLDRSNPRVTVGVFDFGTGRHLAATFKILALNPSPTQKCVPGPSGKPVLAPLCPGTAASCTVTPNDVNPLTQQNFGSVQCADLGTVSNYFTTGSTISCNGNSAAVFLSQQYRAYTCTRGVKDAGSSAFGDYMTIGFYVNSTKSTPSNQYLCPFGCSNGFCVGSAPPTLSTLTANPRRIGITNVNLVMTSVALDRDTVTTGTSSRRQQVTLECGTASGDIVNTGAPIGAGAPQTGSFTADLCRGSFVDSNPTCTITSIPASWRSGGQRNIFCRAKDESGLYSDVGRTSVIVDITPPTSVITSPLSNSVQNTNFVVSASDSDDSGLGTCYYSTSSTAVVNLPTRNIALSNPYTIWRPVDIAYSTKSDVALAVWNYNPNGGNGGGGVAGQLINGGGTLRGSNLLLGSQGAFNGGIKVAYDEDDDLFLVVWGTDDGKALGPATGTLVKPDGTIVRRNIQIAQSCSVGAHASSLGNIVYSKTAKKFFVPCTGDAVTIGTVKLGSVAPDGTVGSPVIVSARGGGTSIAAGTNSLLVLWLDENGYANGRLLDSNGVSFLGAPFRISSADQYHPLTGFYNTVRNEYDVFYGLASLSSRTVKEDGTMGVERTVVSSTTDFFLSDIEQNPVTNSYWVAGTYSVANGNRIYEIKSDGTITQPLDVAEDTSVPNYVPAVTVTKNGVPLTFMNRNGISYIQFGALGAGTVLLGGQKTRTCNGQFTVTVGSGGDCPQQGTCTVNVFAVDTLGNVGFPNSRSFSIKLVSTNITAPASGYQTSNFSVSVIDRNFGGGNLTCTYDVYSIDIGGMTSRKTIDNAPRTCNSNFIITIGPNENCDKMGPNVCRVVAKVDNGVSADQKDRFYSIDWITPESKILSGPTNWVTGDFTIFVIDDPKGSIITECQYRVVSGGTQTVGWTTRNCNIGIPGALTITVGPGKNCRNEGGAACEVSVRPLDRSRMPGFNDTIRVPVILSGNVTDLNGFSTIAAVTTDRGINFSGVTRQELRAATFYVCNINSNPASCISSYETSNSGVDKPNLCGSIGTKCELRCGDANVRYYMAAKGVPIGEFNIVTVVSPIRNASCPVLNTGEINRLVALFRQIDEQLSITIMQIDTFIRQNGETDTANNNTIQLLSEALLITRDHLNYMNISMNNLNTVKSVEIIQRSNQALDRINALIRGLVSPVTVQLDVNMPSAVRVGRQSVLPASVVYSGDRPAYGKVFCTVNKPDFSVIRDSTPCTTFGDGTSQITELPIQFLADKLGTWSYSCRITRSVRQDCSFEVDQPAVSGTFNVLPGLDTYISSVSVPATMLRGQQANVIATITNPDENSKFATVTCDFTDPDSFVLRNTSACTPIAPNGDTSVNVRAVVGKTGNWTVSRCTVRSSQSSNCSASTIDNVSREIRNFSVTTPTDVFIESISMPQQVQNGTRATITMNVLNPLGTAIYVTASCNVAGPKGAVTLEDRKGIESGLSLPFALDLLVDSPGIWTVTRCSVAKSATPDFSNPVVTHAIDNPGSITTITGVNLTITSITVPQQAQNGTNAIIRISFINPSSSRYGRATCSIRNPLNQLSTNISGCVLAGQNSNPELQLPVYLSRVGVWNVESCSLFGSVNSDCSQSALHDTETAPGSIESLTTALSGSSNLFVQNISASNAQINSNINVLVSVKNLNAVNSTYANVACRFVDPFSIATLRTSSCSEVTANSTRQFIVSGAASAPGTWIIRNCSVNASATNSCSPSSLQNISTEVRTLNVTTPNDLYVTSVNAPDNDLANNSNVPIDITVTNAFTDDRFGFVSCTVEDPNGDTQTKTTPCAAVPRQTSRQYNVSVIANVVGTWFVKTCSVSSSASSSCSNAAVTNEMTNGDVFNVIRGYNLTITSVALTDPSYVFRPLDVAYALRNPSMSERFGRVTCTFTKGGQTTANVSGCFQLPPESFVNSKATLVPTTTGSGTVTCVAERSFDSSCSSSGTHDTVSRNFNIVQPPDLFIKSVDMPPLVQLGREARALLTIKNPVQATVYGYAGCTFMNRLNETTRNISSCINMSTDETTLNLGVTPLLRGNWSVSSCYVNVSTLVTCNQSRTHNVSTISKSFTANAPFLVIEGDISLVTNNLFVGDVADIQVNVKNIGERDYYSFVNCTLISPTNSVYRLTTLNQSIPLNTVATFHLQRIVDEAGTWKVGMCSVYRLGSIILEDQQNLNQPFDVRYVSSTDQCNANVPCQTGTCVNGVCVDQQTCSASACPGTKDACYCFSDQCVACGPGYTCSNGGCVPELPINSCSSTRECGPNFECINGLCQKRALECYVNTDCNGGQCLDGRCVTSTPVQIDNNIIYLLVIALIAIMIPIILFIYIRRSLS